jgi:UDP-N-acetylglucosamine diphosphorylase/glucosamine-1-phosphate N-acetyltransferase
MMTSRYNKLAVIILAAGLGTRMKSNKAKVLHTILGKPMVLYVVESAQTVAGRNIIVVVGNQAEQVRELVRQSASARFAYQEKQLGTGHAVLCALPKVPADCDQVLILCGDVPLITARTLGQMLADHCEAGRDITVLAVSLEDPTGYGRILLNDRHQICSIIEEADASEAQKQIKIVNTGIYCVKKELLASALAKVKPDNSQGELYLTDIVETAYTEGRLTGVFMGSDDREFCGVNNLQDLAKVEMWMRQRAGINS